MVTELACQFIVPDRSVMGPVMFGQTHTPVSPGPLMTRFAGGIAHFDALVGSALERAPAHRLVDIAEIGRVVSFLVGGAASGMTGDTIFVDCGLHNVG